MTLVFTINTTREWNDATKHATGTDALVYSHLSFVREDQRGQGVEVSERQRNGTVRVELLQPFLEVDLARTSFLRAEIIEAELHACVPSVLDKRVRSSGQEFRDLGPAVSEDALLFGNDSVLLTGPRAFVDGRVELIVPPLATLFGGSVPHLLRELAPVLRAVCCNKLEELLVLLEGEGALGHLGSH